MHARPYGFRGEPSQNVVFGALVPWSKWPRAKPREWFPPSSGAERVAPDWRQSYGTAEISNVSPEWRAWELARWLCPVRTIGAVCQIATSVDAVEALDAAGNVVYAWSPQNGRTPTVSRLQHPDPAAGVIEWRWVLWQTPAQSRTGSPDRLVGGVPPTAVLQEVWADQSLGSDLSLHRSVNQPVEGGNLARLAVEVRADNGARWRFRVGGRLAGAYK